VEMAAQRRGKCCGSGAKEGGGPRVPDRTFAGHDLPPTGGRVGCATPERERKVEQRWGGIGGD
jgi:hypothetical protein